MILFKQKKYLKFYRFIAILMFLAGNYTPLNGQIHFDYITDWSNIFLSNFNQISPQFNTTNSNLSGSTAKKVSVTSTVTYNDFYREKFSDLERNLSNFQQRYTLQSSLNLKDHIFDFVAEFDVSQKEMNYDLTESQSFHIRNRYKEYRFSLATTFFEKYLWVRGGFGKKQIDRKEFYPWNFGIRFQPTTSIWLTYQRFEDLFRWQYDFRLEDPGIILLADEYTHLDEFQLHINLLAECTLTATMQNNYINKDRTVDVPGTLLIPFGTRYQKTIVLNFFPENRFRLNLSYYSRNHDMGGYFFDSFQKFGKLTEQKDHSEKYQSEIFYNLDSKIIGLSLGWSEGIMINNGYVESWPFAPAWIDLLGIRYNFKSQLSYNLFRIGTSFKYLFSGWQINFSTSFERIIPEGEAKTWEPEIIVFGVQNLKVSRLSTRPYNGVYIGFHLGKSFGNVLRIAYEIHQYIPIEFNTGGTSKNDIVAKQSKSIYGGGKHQVTLAFTL